MLNSEMVLKRERERERERGTSASKGAKGESIEEKDVSRIL